MINCKLYKDQAQNIFAIDNFSRLFFLCFISPSIDFSDEILQTIDMICSRDSSLNTIPQISGELVEFETANWNWCLTKNEYIVFVSPQGIWLPLYCNNCENYPSQEGINNSNYNIIDNNVS